MDYSVEHISKSYRSQKVLKDISFSTMSGECIGFVGPNGCGKTTLLSILVGVEKADDGQILIDKKAIKSGINSSKIRMGYVPQINPLPDLLTVKDCLKLWCDSKTIYSKILKAYDLEDIKQKRISQLSGGMKRRVAIACAMATKPQILVMDEPTAALDITYKKLIHQDMENFVSKGGILLMVTHEQEEIKMCNKCYAIENGVLKQYGANA